MAKEQTPKERATDRSDARNSIPAIPCMHCKHLVSVGSQFDKEGWTCKAFPEQILYGILTAQTPHDTPFASQEGAYQYDPVIYTEEGTGKQWHYNADGTWQYVKP